MPNMMCAYKRRAPQQREHLILAHTPEAIEAWVGSLRQRFAGKPIAICLELNKGPIVSALRTYDFLVLFPVNPLTLARYREAFTPSRAKDDPTDAALQLALLCTHRDKLPPLHPQSPTMRALEPLVEHRRRVVGDKVRLTNRLTSTLKNYFPQALQWFQDKDTLVFCDFLAAGPPSKRCNSRAALPWRPSFASTTYAQRTLLPSASTPSRRPPL